MQSFDMAEKVLLMIDGEELQGLVNFGEIALEKGQIEVPEFKLIRKIQSGVSKIPAIECEFKITRGSNTYKKLRDWYFNDEVHDLTKIRCDASGAEFERIVLPSCELAKYTQPAVDMANVSYAKISVTIIPWEIIPIV